MPAAAAITILHMPHHDICNCAMVIKSNTHAYSNTVSVAASIAHMPPQSSPNSIKIISVHKQIHIIVFVQNTHFSTALIPT